MPLIINIVSKLLFGFLFIFLLSFSFIQSVNAQSSALNPNTEVQGAATMGVAKFVMTKVKNIKDSSVLSSSQDGAVLSTVPYDSQVLGIVAFDAAIQISDFEGTDSVPVISDGTVYVLVSSKNGPIQRGDYLTTSTIPGVAVRADKDGYVLGTSLEAYSDPDPSKTGKIAMDLNLHYFNTKPTLLGSLTDIFKYALLPTKDSPSPIWKYLVAAAVVLASFVLAFMTFGRTAAKGVEALGRNPSASRIIHLGIIFNVSIVVIIVLAGLTVAFLILRL